MRYDDIASLIGPEAADILIQTYGGARLPSPERAAKETRIEAIRRAFRQGATIEQVMERFGVGRSQANIHRSVAYRVN